MNVGVGVFQEYYEDKLLSDYSAGTISWIPSLQIFFMMGMVGVFHAAIDQVIQLVDCTLGTFCRRYL
jgi:hypothetical protein